MPLTLHDAMYYTRQILGEAEAIRWSDAFLIASLNARASQFQNAAGSITGFANLPLAQGIYGQETVLPRTVDTVKSVKYFQGSLYALERRSYDELQSGNFTGSIPLWYYIKEDATQLTPQAAGGDIEATDLLPGGPQGAGFYQVLGVWPIPSAPTFVEVFYSYFHPYMHDTLDQSPIPTMFLPGWTAGTIADCLKVEKAYAEAQGWEQMFATEMEKYRQYSSKHKSSKPARYGQTRQPWRESASSSVILISPTGQ
jgi:hypothetical protein